MAETRGKGCHPVKNRLLEHAAACALMSAALVVGGCAATQKLENAVLSDSVPYAGEVVPTVAPKPAPEKSPWVERVEAVAQEKQKVAGERRPGTTFAEKVVSRRKSALEMLVAPLLPDDGEKPETIQNFAEKAAAAAVKEEEAQQETAAAEADLPPLPAEPVLPETAEAEAVEVAVPAAEEPVAAPVPAAVTPAPVAEAPAAETAQAPEPASIPVAAEPAVAEGVVSAPETPAPVAVAADVPTEVPPPVSAGVPVASNWVQKLRMAAGRKAEIVTEKQLTEGGARVAAVPPVPVMEQETETETAAVAEAAPEQVAVAQAAIPETAEVAEAPKTPEAAEAPKPSSWAERLAALVVARPEPEPEAPVVAAAEPVAEAPVVEPEAPVVAAAAEEAPVVESEAPVVAAVEPVAEAPVVESEAPVVAAAAEPMVEAPVAEPMAETPVGEPMVVAAVEPVAVPVEKKPDFLAGQQAMHPPAEEPHTSKWVKDFRAKASVPSIQEEIPEGGEPVAEPVAPVVEIPAVEPAGEETPAAAVTKLASELLPAIVPETPADTGVPEVLSVSQPVEAHPEIPEVMAVQEPLAASPELPEVMAAQKPAMPAAEVPEVAVAAAPVVEVAEKPVSAAKPKKHGSLLFGSAPEKSADPGIPLFFVEQEMKPVRGVEPPAVMVPLLDEMPGDAAAAGPVEEAMPAPAPVENAVDDEAMAEGYPSLASVPAAPVVLSEREVLLRDMMKSDHAEGMKMISEADLPQLEIREPVAEAPVASAPAESVAEEVPVVVVEEALVQPEEAPVVIVEEAPVSIHEPTAEMTEVLEKAAQEAAVQGLNLHDPETPRALKDYDSADTSVSLLAGVVRFGHASMEVGDDYRRVLADVARLQGTTGGILRVVGHASRKADAPDALKEMMVNFSLSIDRANVVAAELIKMGVPADHIYVGARGQSEPASMPIGEETEEDSRRTEIFLDY